MGPIWARELGRPAILGHRGASAHYPENTMLAFSKAIEAGADGVELDLRQCASGELMVFHDEDLSRMCGESRQVGQLSRKELGEVRVRGERIPVLSDVLQAFPDARINLELKPHPVASHFAVVRELVHEVRAAHAFDRVLVSSFDPRLLAMCRALAPEMPRGLLCAEEHSLPLRRAWAAPFLDLAAIHPEHTLINAERLLHWWDRGYQVNTWTVDDPTILTRLATLGVDSLICNDPGAALAHLRAACVPSANSPVKN